MTLVTRCLIALLLTAVVALAADRPSLPPSGRKRALLVAISNYPANDRARKTAKWPQLHADRDAQNLRQVLMEKYGFRDADIQVCLDEQATRQGILDAFRKHLIQPAQPGDVVLFMFSGHGQQVLDDNGDNDEQDGLDETFVPFDYISMRAADGARTNVRDDDLYQLLKELSGKMRGPDGKVQGNITVVIDSCHSGTMVRGSQITKGRGWDPALDGPKPKGRAQARGGPRGPLEGQTSPEGSGLISPEEALAQGYVMLTACQSHESAFEISDDRGNSLGGAMIYALCKALRDVPPQSPTTYRDLFERVKLEVKAARQIQTPNLDGEVDQLLFSGLARPEPFYPVVEAYNDGEVTIGAGRLHGVTENSRYALYKPGSDTTDPSNRLVDVTITRVDAFRSRAALPKGERSRLTEKELLAAKAVLTAQSYAGEKLRVLLEGTGRLAASLKAAEVAEKQDALELISAEAASPKGPYGRPNRPAYDVRIALESPPAGDGGARALIVRRDDDTLVGTPVPDDAQAGLRLRQRLLGLWRWRFLSQLESPRTGTSLHVGIRVVPVIRDSQGRYQDRAGAERSAGGPLVLTAGDLFQIELENKGRGACYVTVIDLQPDGSMQPIFPHPTAATTVENFIPAREARRVPLVFHVQAPYGTDVFKAIATPESIDFRPLFFQAEAPSRGERARRLADAQAAAKGTPGKAGPLVRLLLSAATGMRGAGVEGVDPEYWGTASVMVETRAP